MKKLIILFSLAIFTLFTAGAQQKQIVTLWPNGAPHANGMSDSLSWQGKNVARFGEMCIFSPDKSNNTGKALVICPGGGYAVVCVTYEGWDVAQWLAEQGITAIVVNYRLPNNHREVPQEDAEQAIRLARQMSGKLGVDPNKIGISGFSAGGHLASTVLTHTTDPTAKPNFGILFYPVISARLDCVHAGSYDNLLGKKRTTADNAAYSNELQVTTSTPPTMLMLSDDDGLVPPENSILFYEALKRNGVKSELHIFPMGGHGWGFHDSFPYKPIWTNLVLDWIKRM